MQEENKISKKKVIIGAIVVIILILLFIFAKKADPTVLEKIGLKMPLPLFTILIALIDGFNPCTLWVLTLLLTLLISVSHSRKRIFAVGYTFVIVVYIIYFLFMTAWLNIFLFVGYADIIRIIIAIVALVAGAINVKDYFFLKKGISLTIGEKSRSKIIQKMREMRVMIEKGSLPALIFASIVLAFFSSLVELPCTAGFPVIYTNILTHTAMEGTLNYYLYLLFYNLFYIIPLSVIITLFGVSFKGKRMTKEQGEFLKLIGGAIMIALGIILLVNPSLLIMG